MNREQVKFEQDNSFVLSYDKVVAYVQAEILKEFPGYEFTPGEDKWHYTFKPKNAPADDKKQIISNFENVWENYDRTKDLGIINPFIASQKKAIEYMINGKHDIDAAKVFPVLRTTGFKKNMDGSAKGISTLLSDTFSDVLDVVYVEDHEHMVTFLVENNLPAGLDSDQTVQRAFANLKAQGWVDADESVAIDDIATIHFYQETDKQYQAQFMVKEMYQPHLGDFFYVAFPTRDVTIVVQWHKPPHEVAPLSLGITQTLKGNAWELYNNGQGPLTHVLHRVSVTEGIKALA